MRLVTIDTETYWDSEHTLTKMSPMAYVMSPKTEIICAAIKVGAGETQVFFGESEVRQAFAGIDWGTSMVVAHNMSGFDSMILAWRFGVRPKMWACTLAMARPLHSKTTGNSLAKLVAHYKIGVKNQTVLTQTKGKNLKDFTQPELADMRRYNQEDTDQCYALFNELKRHYSTAELWQIDATIRMLVEPAFSVNRPMLEEALVVEIDRKRKSILTLAQHLKRSGIGSDAVGTAKTVEALEGAVRADLASSAKFATLLRSLDVAVPMKPSPTNPSKEVPALAKTDEAFLALQEHDNEVVAAAARGRLAVKSTLLETRIGAFLEASAAVGGKLPVPLNYCGADTTGRWSGWAYNCQNLHRINPKTPKVSDALRNCMQAPPGHKIIVSDLSGIELRVNHFLWKVKESIDLYKSDPEADLYRAFAAARYRVTPEEVTKDQRQLAKMCLAEGTLVLTDEGEVPIEQVTARHRVWDGVEWVSTLGAIYKGERDVIEYDGITATPDHEVWVEDGRKIPVRAAAAQSCRLARTGAGGVPLGFGGVGVSGSPENQGAQARTGSLHVLRDDQSNQLREPSQGGDERLPELLAKERRPGVAATAAGSGTTTLHQPERRRVQAVWGTGDTVSIRDRSSGSGVGGGEHRLGSLEGVGSNRQQRELRSGQHALGYEETKHSEPDQVEVSGVPSVSAGAPRGALRGQHAAKPTEPGTYVRADPTAVEPTIGQTKRRVWDLLNCGPRHRFTANGRLVSNCQLGLGFGAGWRTFQKVAKLMGGLDLSEEDAEAVTVAWRAQYAEIVRGWKLCHASLGHIYDGVEQPIDPWGLCVTCAEGIRLPTGRIIRYPDLRSEHNEDGSKEWVYGQGRHKARIYAGKVDENCVQALARDVIAGNALDFFKRTKLRPALMVHDELVYVVPESDAQAALDELQAIMRTPPKWWPSLVTWSEGDVADTYGAAK